MMWGKVDSVPGPGLLCLGQVIEQILKVRLNSLS